MVEIAHWMEPEDPDILRIFRDHGKYWIRELDKEGILHINRRYAYSRCKRLALHGLLQDNGNRNYEITIAGERFLSGELDPDNPQKGFDRIVDLSTIDAANFKYRNMKFLHSDARYNIRNHERLVDVRNNIWRIRNGDIRKLLRRFPRDVPLINQCAFWMRAWTGKHFFPDANHRTAIATLRELLLSFRFDINHWPIHRTVSAIKESKSVRLNSTYELDTLYVEDMHYYVWWFHFADVLKTELKEKKRRYSASTSPRA